MTLTLPINRSAVRPPAGYDRLEIEELPGWLAVRVTAYCGEWYFYNVYDKYQWRDRQSELLPIFRREAIEALKRKDA